MTKADRFREHCNSIVIEPSDIEQRVNDMIAIIKSQIVEICKIKYALIKELNNISQANIFLDYLGNSFYVAKRADHDDAPKETDSDKLDIIMISRLFLNLYYDPETETIESFTSYYNNKYDEMFLYSYMYKNMASRFNKEIRGLNNIVNRVCEVINNTEKRKEIVEEQQSTQENHPF